MATIINAQNNQAQDLFVTSFPSPRVPSITTVGAEGFNEKASLCLAIRKKGEKIMVREVNLNALPPKERAIFYEDMAVEDFIVSGNYYYIIVDRKLYCHKKR